MPVIATAGHVDHGKSTLVQALTGRDPDRLAEEKRRGMTIDLGFAWMTLPNGVDVSFVDVPGHETLLKNMLAGTVGVDIGLAVVAADEGWKPQTEEHIAVLSLLHIPRGVIAITKTDLAGSTQLQRTTGEVGERLQGTGLGTWPVVALSALTGEGLAHLVDVLTPMAAASIAEDAGRPRLWVDRSFTVPGAGTVVTGTLTGGSLMVGDQVQIWPTRNTPRIRSLQTHERSVDQASPGRRLAIALSGLKPDVIRRGFMVGRPGQWEPTSRVLAALDIARYVDDVPARGAYQFHVGTAVTTGRHQPISATASIIQLDQAQPLKTGDRLIIRDVGRRQVVGAATVLDPTPASTAAAKLSLPILEQAGTSDPDIRATALLETRGRDTIARLQAHTGGGTPPGLRVGPEALSPSYAAHLLGELHDLVSRDHTDQPLDPGMPKATLASRLGVPVSILDTLVAQDTTLQARGDVIAETTHTPHLDTQQQQLWAAARKTLERAGLQPPPMGDLGLSHKILQFLVRSRHLIRINQTYALLPSGAERILDLLDRMLQPFTVADFRNAAHITRRHAIPYLEWADTNGHTRRTGDLRTSTRSGGGRESNPPGAIATPQRF